MQERAFFLTATLRASGNNVYCLEKLHFGFEERNHLNKTSAGSHVPKLVCTRQKVSFKVEKLSFPGLYGVFLH